MARFRLVVCLPILLSCSAVTTSYRYPDDLGHPDYVKRTQAVRDFADRRDAAQLPGAFDLLLDRECAIRVMAHETIRSLSLEGRDFGYRPWLSDGVLRGIVSRWRAWWEAGQPADDGGGAGAAAEPGEAPPPGEATGG